MPGNGHNMLLMKRPATAQKIGYGRVSTDDQVLDVQIDALQKAGCDHIFSETVSAVNAKRPEYHLMRKHIERGDTLIVHSFSRLSRDLKQLLTIVDELKVEGVKLISLTEPHIDPYTTNGRLLISVTGAVDENERGRVRDRTKTAMQHKIAAGMYVGAPVKVTPDIARKMKALRKAGVSVPKIAKQFGVSNSAVATQQTYWWNGSGWVVGRLPANLRDGMDLCVRRKRKAEDTPANLTGSKRKAKPGKSHRIG